MRVWAVRVWSVRVWAVKLACRRVRALLPAFAGNDLDASRVEPVREHLRRCDPCRREAGRFLQSTRALGAVVTRAPKLGDEWFGALHAEILGAVAAGSQETGSAEPVGAGSSSAPWLRWSRWLAAAAVLFAGGVLLQGGLLDGRLQGVTTDTGMRGRAAIDVQDVKVVPWSGERMPRFRMLGFEEGVSRAEDGSGMMGRLRLHTLEDLHTHDDPHDLEERDATGRAQLRPSTPRAGAQRTSTLPR